MKNLFEKEALAEIEQRIQALQPGAAAQWGKMNVAQMLAHCNIAFEYPNKNIKKPRLFMGRLIGWAIKPMIYNDKPTMKNAPTAPEFVMDTQKNFEEEKANLLSAAREFNRLGPTGAGLHPHPMFGRLTPEQWGCFMYKHLDHHLTQFGA